MACTDTGEVFTWGDNDEGQLGDGTTNAIQRPKIVSALKGTCSNIYGSRQTLHCLGIDNLVKGKWDSTFLANILFHGNPKCNGYNCGLLNFYIFHFHYR